MENLVVCMGKGAQFEAAVALAKRVNAPLVEKPGKDLTLLIDGSGVTLTGYGLSYRGDFEEMLHRVTDGRLQHEMISRLVKTDNPHPTAIDATAGMGEDAFIIAACGYEVTLYEQNPVIAALLKDALRRAKKHPILKEIAARMTLVNENSIAYMPKAENVDLIYLDPMFPARQKSGLIGKKLQLIQKLEQPCFEEEALLSAAIAANPKKIVIKRPLKGPNLAGRTPSYTIAGKAIRYDCIVLSGD